MKPSKETFCVLTDSRFTGGVLARRYVGGDSVTTVRSGNKKWTNDSGDIWHMTRADAEEIAARLVYNNPRICASFKAMAKMGVAAQCKGNAPKTTQ